MDIPQALVGCISPILCNIMPDIVSWALVRRSFGLHKSYHTPSSPLLPGENAGSEGRTQDETRVRAGLGVRGLRGGEFLARGRVDGVVKVG